MWFGKQNYGIQMRGHETPMRAIDVRDEEAYEAAEMRMYETTNAIMHDPEALRKMVVTKVCPSYEAQEAMKFTSATCAVP